MGKGNFILGTGSSSIGDVTFARRNGQQIARVRVRKIKNPRSYGQAEQRMISSEVVKFYSPLSGVLETSFEGLSKSESYAKFLSINMNLARANGWAVEKGSGFVALPFQLSAGSLPQAEVDNTLALVIGGTGEITTFGALSSAIKTKYNLQEGDQVTFVSVDDTKSIVYNRFFIDTTSTATLPSGYVAENGKFVFVSAGASVAFGVIFSRWNGEKWARSNAFLVCNIEYMAQYTGETNYAAAVATYMNGAGRTPVSDVYLNGDDGQ